MITKKIQLKPETTDEVYTAFCNKAEKDGVFLSCGNCDDKWIMVKFEDEVDMTAWIISLTSPQGNG